VGIVTVWLVSAPFWPNLKEWQVAIHTVGSVLSLLLLVLLENAGRRADEASQEKLNVIAEALAALMESQSHDDPDLDGDAKRLRDAVGLEERH
jgi:low affinity Fe/Cu permease